MKSIQKNTKLRLIKLWPHARKQGREINQLWTVKSPCSECGEDIIWLQGKTKDDLWTIDNVFLKKHFEILQ